MAKLKNVTRKIIDESCYMIFRECDYISLHTNRQNRESINMIRKNLMSLHSAVRDLQNENLKLKAEKNKIQESRLNYV